MTEHACLPDDQLRVRGHQWTCPKCGEVWEELQLKDDPDNINVTQNYYDFGISEQDWAWQMLSNLKHWQVPVGIAGGKEGSVVSLEMYEETVGNGK